MRTLLFFAVLIFPLSALFGAEDRFSAVPRNAQEFVAKSDKGLKNLDQDQGTPIQKARSAYDMKSKAIFHQALILSLLHVDPETMSSDLSFEKKVEEIRKNFCDEASKERLTNEYLKPILETYQNLLVQEKQWETRIVNLSGTIPHHREGSYPGSQKELLSQPFKASKLPSLHDGKSAETPKTDK